MFKSCISVQEPYKLPLAKIATKQPKMIRFWILKCLESSHRYALGGGQGGGQKIGGEKNVGGTGGSEGGRVQMSGGVVGQRGLKNLG